MTAKELFEAGDLPSAIARVGEDLRNDPANESHRIFLFELLCLTGDLDRAARQLDALAAKGADSALAVQSYRNALEGEKKRRLCFTTGQVPGLPKHVPDYTRFHLDALNHLRAGEFEEAVTLLEKAEELRPPVRGAIDDVPFEDLKDADDLIGPFLEVITPSNYAWIPWEIVRGVSILAPQHLRDTVWIPARVELEFGSLGEVFIPVLYAGSYLHPDPQVKMGRVTDWKQDTGGLALASGQRVLVADDRDAALLEIRSIEIEPGE